MRYISMPLGAARLLCAATLFAACAPAALAPLAPTTVAVPDLPREFRGVWIASVANIDWPSEPGLPPEQQRAELLAMLNRASRLNLNAVILQVRPAADALYASDLEPWSEYLTGEMGRAPEPFYDPLAFAVEEAHRRGLELHAWFNPYRARHPSARSPIAPSHLSRTHPDLVKGYGAQLWMDPGEPAVREHSTRVVLDVVRRYDIDGVHIDDYFYPYPERDSAGAILPFPDDASWQRYLQTGGMLERDDWRRRNVDLLVERLYTEIKAAKPWVKFGISPFGIWRPGYPAGIITRFDQYGQIYADARKWLVNGWLDYFTPQLYWPVAAPGQSFPVLLRWWAEQNVRERHLWPGLFTNRVLFGGTPFWPVDEVAGQIYITRGQPGATGQVHFSMRTLMRSDTLAERLLAGPYALPALPPASPWLGNRPPASPGVRAEPMPGGNAWQVRLAPSPGTPPIWWVVRTRFGDLWTVEVVPASRGSHSLPAAPAGAVAAADLVVVSAVDRVGNEGPAAHVPLGHTGNTDAALRTDPLRGN